MEVVLTWNPGPFMNGVVGPAVAEGLNAAANIGQTEMKRQFVVRTAPGLETKVPPTLGRKGKGPGSYVSAPFAAPSYQSGGTSRSVRVLQYATAARLSATVGTTNPVGAYLQTGTSKMAPRPWVSLAVRVAKPKMQLAFLQAARSRMRTGAAA